jgi:hypothetical protein
MTVPNVESRFMGEGCNLRDVETQDGIGFVEKTGLIRALKRVLIALIATTVEGAFFRAVGSFADQTVKDHTRLRTAPLINSP